MTYTHSKHDIHTLKTGYIVVRSNTTPLTLLSDVPLVNGVRSEDE